jgi:hypothetical protein
MLPGRVHPEAWGVAAAAACAEIRNLSYKGRRSVPEWEFWSILIGRLKHPRSYFGLLLPVSVGHLKIKSIGWSL